MPDLQPAASKWPALIVPEDWQPGTGVHLGGWATPYPSTEGDVSAQPTGDTPAPAAGDDTKAQQSGVDIAAHMSNELGVVPPLLPDHIAAHVAPDLGISLVGDQTGQPVVDAAHHIAASVASDLKVDPPPPAGVSQAQHIAQSVAPDLKFDPTRFNAASEPVTSDVGVPDKLIETLAARRQPSGPTLSNQGLYKDTPAAMEPSSEWLAHPDETPSMDVVVNGVRGGIFVDGRWVPAYKPLPFVPGETPEQKAFDVGATRRLTPTSDTMGAVVDPTTKYAQTVFENAKRQFEGRPEDIWSGLIGPGNLGVVEGPGGMGGPEFAKGLTKALGIEPKEPPIAPIGKPPKYSLKNPPPKTATLPDVSTLSDPFQIAAHEKVQEHDAANAPDDAYRNIFSAGAKEMKSNGQPKDAPTWRDKVVNVLNSNASKAPQAAVAKAHQEAEFLQRQGQQTDPRDGALRRAGYSEPQITSMSTEQKKSSYAASETARKRMDVARTGQTFPGDWAEDQLTNREINNDPNVVMPENPPSARDEPGQTYNATAARKAAQSSLEWGRQNGLDRQGVIDALHDSVAGGITRDPETGSHYADVIKELEAPAGTVEGRATRLPPANVPDFGAAPREAPAGGGRQPPEPPPPPGGGTGEPPDFGKELGDVARRNVAAGRLPPKMKTATVTEMEDDLHRLRTGAQADRAEAENFMKTLPEETGKRDAELYRIGEHKELQGDPDYQKYGVPFYNEELKLVNRLRELTGDKELQADPEWMHRMVQGKTPRMDEAIGTEEALPYKGFKHTLSTAADANKSRGIFAIEDAQGNRKVVTEYPGGDAVYTWDKGKPTQLKAGQFGGYGGFIRRVPEHEVGGQEIPWRRTIDRPVVAKAEGGRINLGYIKKGGREIPAHTTPERTVPERVIPGEFKVGDEFHDKDNKVWQITQAKTDEIEKAGVRTQNEKGQLGQPITYHKNFFASKLTNIASLRRAVRNAEFLDKWKNSPDFQRYSVPIKGEGEGAIGIGHNQGPPLEEGPMTEQAARKAGWVPVDYPGWRGRLYDPRFAEPLNDFFHGLGNSSTVLGKAMERANQIATDSMFWTGIGSLAHARNETSMAFSARGFHNLDPRTLKWFGKAVDEVRHQGPIYIQALREGAHLPSAGMKADSLEEHLLNYVGEKVAHSDPASLAEAAKAAGLGVKDFVRARQLGVGRAVFKYGDMLMMEHIIRQMDRGYTMRQAIDDAEKLLPTYRIRSRTGGTGKVARMTSELLGNRNITQFGRFTADKGKFWNNLVRDSLSAGSPFSGFTPKQRMDAVGRLTATIVLVGVIGPYVLDRIAKELTGDKNAHINLGGAAGWAQHAINAVQSVKSGRMAGAHAAYDFLNGFINVAPAIKELLQQVSGPQGLDWFTNQHIRESNPTPGQGVKESLKHAGKQFSPYAVAPSWEQLKQAWQHPGQIPGMVVGSQALREPFGLSVAKPFSDRPRSLGAMKKQQFQDMRTRNR